MLSSRSRTNVAAQACETCRRRKTKCDEARPKCTLCQRLNLECKYQEPAPVKKDETVGRILDSLQRLEAKFDDLSVQGGFSPTPLFVAPRVSPPFHQRRLSFSESSKERSQPQAESSQGAPGYGPRQLTHPYFTAPHRIIVWPTVYSQLTETAPSASADLDALSESGTPWLVRLEMNRHGQRLPFDAGLTSQALATDSNQSLVTSKTMFPSLTSDLIESYVDAYFSTFNVLYPILSRELFTNGIMSPPLADGFTYGDTTGVLTLLVLALGQLALESVAGVPIGEVDGEASGIRGGSALRPPGLELFNEARARIGSVGLECDLMNVQVLLLQGTYFEASACHVEYWRSTVTASMTCQVLAQFPDVAWSTERGDLIKRAFWACTIDEDFYHLDLDLPRTGIREFADKIQLPHFHDTQEQRKTAGSGDDEIQSLFQYHFLAKISLARVITRIHDAVHFYSSQFETLDDYSGPPIHVIREMSRQLDSWRAWLPAALQWSDEDVSGSGSEAREDPRDKRPKNPFAASQSSTSATTTADTGRELLMVELRARFYYARFILCRPFIFKALHFAQLMNAQDSEYCALAIQDACLWPLALSPAREKKRLLPHLFTWTQNFIAILLILWTSQHNKCLRQICNERLNSTFLQKAVAEMLHWIKDIKQVDGIADWAWHQLLEPLFSGNED